VNPGNHTEKRDRPRSKKGRFLDLEGLDEEDWEYFLGKVYREGVPEVRGYYEKR